MKNKILLIIIGLLVLMLPVVLSQPIAMSTYIDVYGGQTYSSTITRTTAEVTTIMTYVSPYKKCDASSGYTDPSLARVLTNYEYAAKFGKSCSYLYLCAVILPQYSSNLNDAVWGPKCLPMETGVIPSIPIKFTPQAGKRYAVSSFVALEQKTYNLGTAQWATIGNSTVAGKYLKAEDVIGLCPSGYMMRDGWCYEAKPFCINQQGVNVCTNKYQLYCLNYGNGFDCDTKPEHFCADGQTIGTYTCAQTGTCLDGICDDVITSYCPDNLPDVCPIGYACTCPTGQTTCTYTIGTGTDTCTNGVITSCQSGSTANNNICEAGEMCGNGVCDVDDVLIKTSLCWDGNTNGICDNVESELCYCTKEFNPVCVGTTTFPNPCFAECQGQYTYTQGACTSLTKQCDLNTDCVTPANCNPLSSPLCINQICDYSAVSCSLRACDTSSDCTPEKVCVGLTATCDSHYCNYHGQCVTKPDTDIYGNWLLNLFNTIWAWIKSILGWR